MMLYQSQHYSVQYVFCCSLKSQKTEKSGFATKKEFYLCTRAHTLFAHSCTCKFTVMTLFSQYDTCKFPVLSQVIFFRYTFGVNSSLEYPIQGGSRNLVAEQEENNVITCALYVITCQPTFFSKPERRCSFVKIMSSCRNSTRRRPDSTM